MTEPLLAIENLHFAWPGAPVLRGAHLTLLPGQSIGLQGANGSGKTTLFRCITGLLKADSGAIRLHGKLVQTGSDFVKLRREVGFCLQNAEDQLIFPTVLEDVCFGPLNLGLTAGEARKRARETLAGLRLAAFEDRLTHRLSGGEQRLVALAGVLAMRPQALLLDEPLNELDHAAASRVMEVIGKLPCAKIIVSHDADFLRKVCPTRLRLVNGKCELYE